jgi:hypothetical protein
MAHNASQRADEAWQMLEAPEADRERLLERQEVVERDFGMGF